MKLDNRQLGMMWVILTLVIAMVPQVISMPVQLLPMIVVPVTWRVLAELKAWKPVPMLVRVSATGLAVLFLMITYGGLLGRRAAVSLLVLMLALKLLETFRVRDARIISSLSLFLCGTQYLFSQGIPMLIYTGLVMTGALVSMTLLQRREAYSASGVAPPSGHSILSELGYSTKLLLMAIPAALALFLFFPRWGGPLWGVPETALDAKTGLSGTMTPGSIQNLFMDDSPAFRAEFSSAIPPTRDLYWRGPVFWEYDGQTWQSSFYSRNLRPETMPVVEPDSIRYTIQMEPTEQHWMFALDYPVSTPRRSRLTMDFQLVSFRPITSLRSYEMVSTPRFVDSPRLRPTLRNSALALPAGFNPRTREMMQSWRDETPDDVALVNRVLAWFNRETFFYTLNPPLLTTHTVDEFLFETRRGFCEHYASAFTVMMRMAGIPARVVTGYQGGWYNALDNYVLVRQSDAHAWSEVWMEGVGWTRVDPTAAVAPGRVEQGAMNALSMRRYLFDYAWIRDIRNGIDVLQRRWNDWVIAFGLQQQSRLFEPLGLEELDTKWLVVIMILAILVISALMMPVVLMLRLDRSVLPAVRLWEGFRRKLARAGVATSPAMTPREVSQLAGTELSEHSDEIERIARLYRDTRYAPDPPGQERLKDAVKRFRPARRAQ